MIGAGALILRQPPHLGSQPRRERDTLSYGFFCGTHERSIHHSAPNCTTLPNLSAFGPGWPILFMPREKDGLLTPLPTPLLEDCDLNRCVLSTRTEDQNTSTVARLHRIFRRAEEKGPRLVLHRAECRFRSLSETTPAVKLIRFGPCRRQRRVRCPRRSCFRRKQGKRPLWQLRPKFPCDRGVC
jgi:hypothetical protein